MAHAIARRSRRRRRRHSNPYKVAKHWHNLDGLFSKRAGGRYIRRHKGHALRSNPRRRSARHSHAMTRLFANPYYTGRGRKRRLRRLDGRYSKRKGYGRARRHGRHMVKHNPRRRRSRRSRRHHGLTRRSNPSRKRRGKRRAKKGARRARRSRRAGRRTGRKASRRAAGRKAARTRARNRRRRAVLQAYALGAVKRRSSRRVSVRRMSRPMLQLPAPH